MPNSASTRRRPNVRSTCCARCTDGFFHDLKFWRRFMNTRATDADILADIFGEAGYSTAFSIGADELAFLRTAIFGQWIERIRAACPEHEHVFRDAGLEHYHRHAHLVAHSTLWQKESRVLPRETAIKIREFDFVRRLTAMFGAGTRISDVVLFSGTVPDYPEIYWRLVRPDATSDVGAMHTDRWFHRVQGQNGAELFGPDERTVKMWLSIHTEPGLNGLYVVPGSHKRTWRVEYVNGADGYPRPRLDEPLAESERLLLPVVPGQAVLFGENLLHGGAVNAGSKSRVSVEMTFVFKRTGLL
ncbi:phytanoyl-CoA dioxygenase family protein [Burkholderia sp. WAC0059]|uniref:phytanoyl-CoA dioxygenase family protein n=1 Tax=Burkholderia sp. WAC0059 TaxID=2066022 RepID=UPI0015E076F2|nr:phytanoyl-CoA dioxygenase family protein [Burkholderia sp. WAC0059]